MCVRVCVCCGGTSSIPQRARPSQMLEVKRYLPGKVKCSWVWRRQMGVGGWGVAVWSRQCLCFQGSHLIDGSCHVLNRSIFPPPLRMLRLDCKQTRCWVTAYQLPPPLQVSLDLLGNLFSFFHFYFLVSENACWCSFSRKWVANSKSQTF